MVKETLALRGKSATGGTVKNEIMSIHDLAEELHKPIMRKLEKQKVHSSFIDNILGANLANMQIISRFNEEIRFLFCVVDIFSKYAWCFPLKHKEGTTIINVLQKVLVESICRPIKIWVDKDSEVYNRSMESRF